MARKRGFFGTLTNWLGGGADAAAEEQLNKAIGEFNLPVPEEIAFNPELLEYTGDFTPQQLQALFQQRSELNNIAIDPRLEAAQMQGLGELQDIVDSDGLTASDRFRLAQISQEQAAQERGAREAIMQNARARGIAGSGLEMLSQLQAQQDAATRANMQGLGVAAQAQDAQRAAINDLAGLGGAIRGQSFNEQAQVASADDIINRFNVGNQQQVAQFNVANRNAAAMRNLDAQQALNNANVGMRNEAQMYNNQAGQRRFGNEMQLRGARANARQGLANNLSGQAAGARQMAKDIGKGVAKIGQAVVTGMNEGGLVPGQATEGDSVPAMLTPGEFVVRKEDVPRFLEAAHKNDDGSVDVAGILDSVTGGKYKFKGRAR